MPGLNDSSEWTSRFTVVMTVGAGIMLGSVAGAVIGAVLLGLGMDGVGDSIVAGWVWTFLAGLGIGLVGGAAAFTASLIDVHAQRRAARRAREVHGK